MRKAILIFLCFSLAGCVGPLKGRKLQHQVTEFNQTVLQQEELIARLKEQLQEQEDELNKRELKIKELRKKLENFGVF